MLFCADQLAAFDAELLAPKSEFAACAMDLAYALKYRFDDVTSPGLAIFVALWNHSDP